MALILHLTDLHLGTTPLDTLDDYKSEFVPIAERVTRHKVLTSTLSALSRHLTDTGQIIDAVLISGDVTYANSIEGFEALAGTLEILGDRLPPTERIVVVPGNHDVKWGAEPSSPERYENFCSHVRRRGYVTALLDGVDPNPPRPERHLLFLDGGKVQIVPLNSSNYCGVVAPLKYLTDDQWKTIETAPNVPNLPLLAKEIKSLRSYDAARFSPQQFQAVSTMIGAAAPPEKTGRIRIALLHHHLLPVSTSEEVKPFESVVNLGALRNFLVANEFDIVLHGHKHTGSIFWDTMTPFATAGTEPPRRVLVISGSTIGATDGPRAEVCRLLQLDTTTSAPRLTVTRVPAIEPGGRIRKMEGVFFPLWDDAGASDRDSADPKTICGGSLDEVYDRILAFFEGRRERDATQNLLCEILCPPSSGTLPTNYPEIPGRDGAQREDWLRQLVRWWQRSATTLDSPVSFTHGQRIYRLNGKDNDQLKIAVEALRQKVDTSRAIVSLVGPGSDRWDSKDEAPSFCSVQFLVARHNSNLRLNCLAYFRKQEMRYWWPVNIGELVLLQQQALESLRPKYRDLLAGSIITLSAIAVVSESVPKVAVPIVDRLLDEEPDMLWQLAYSLVWSHYPQRNRIEKRWDELLDNLLPPVKPDLDGVPVAIKGLEELIKDLDRFGRLHTEGPIQEIRRELNALLLTNRSFAHDSRTDIERSRHNNWRSDCEQIIGRLRGAIHRCFSV